MSTRVARIAGSKVARSRKAVAGGWSTNGGETLAQEFLIPRLASDLRSIDRTSLITSARSVCRSAWAGRSGCAGAAAKGVHAARRRTFPVLTKVNRDGSVGSSIFVKAGVLRGRRVNGA